MEAEELGGKQFLQTIRGRAARFVGALLLSLTFMAGTLASATAIAQQSCPTPGYGLDDAVCTDPITSDWAYGSFKTVEELIATLPPTIGPCTLDPTSLGPFHLVNYYGGNPTYASVAAWIGGALGFIDWLEMADINYQCPTNHVPSYIRYTIERTRGIFCPAGFNESNATFIRCWSRQKALTITLSGGTEVEPSKGSDIKTLPIIAAVRQSNGQLPGNPVKVHVSLKVDPKSGGHDHGDSTRPRGGIAEVGTCATDSECWPGPQSTGSKGMTDGNGQVVFNFNAPEASGTHTISATCDGCSNTATKPVDVKVSDLWPIPGSAYYALTEDGSTQVIGSTTKHVYNHYLTSTASLKLWRLAANFYNYQIFKGVKKPALLHLNDGSLKWGGVFDLDEDWDEPHAEHRRGTVIDVRANSNPGAIPAADFIAFKAMATQLKVDPHFEGGSTNQHFHLRLLNRKE